MTSLPNSPDKQRGAVLLVLFLVVFAFGASIFLASVNTHAVEMRRFNDVRHELDKAKQTLIAYARNYHTFGFDHDGDTFTDDEGPGRLICPNVDNDLLGLADSNVTDCTDNVRGRLPEKVEYNGNTFLLNNAFADIDQQFWYVVSPAFKEITTGSVNHLTTGNLSIDGVSGYIAVIIAPGEALAGQDRSASQTSAANYLEQGNLTGTSFINSYPADPDAFNDQVIGIRAEDLKLDEIVELFTEKPRKVLAAHYSTYGFLPNSMTAFQNHLRSIGLRWFIDEGYISAYSNYFYNSYPYVRYNLNGCTSYWYWFIPVSPYSPNFTYVSGTPC